MNSEIRRQKNDIEPVSNVEKKIQTLLILTTTIIKRLFTIVLIIIICIISIIGYVGISAQKNIPISQETQKKIDFSNVCSEIQNLEANLIHSYYIPRYVYGRHSSPKLFPGSSKYFTKTFHRQLYSFMLQLYNKTILSDDVICAYTVQSMHEQRKGYSEKYGSENAIQKILEGSSSKGKKSIKNIYDILNFK